MHRKRPAKPARTRRFITPRFSPTTTPLALLGSPYERSGSRSKPLSAARVAPKGAHSVSSCIGSAELIANLDARGYALGTLPHAGRSKHRSAARVRALPDLRFHR